MMDIDAVREMTIRQLRIDEGFRARPYDDNGHLSIGYGRNLTDTKLRVSEAELMLANDVNEAMLLVCRSLPWATELDDARISVLINMAFNLGLSGLLTFKKFLLALKSRDFKLASDEMLDSRWAKQVKDRAWRLAQIIKGE